AACATSSVPQTPAIGNVAPPSLSTPDVGPASGLPLSQTTVAQCDVPQSPVAANPWLHFSHVKSQLPIPPILEHRQLVASLSGLGSQRRGACPVHGQGKGRTFSVHLEDNLFRCFDPQCGIKGDVIDLWAAVKGLKLRDAALELVTLFHLEAAPATEKRHG